MSRQRTPFFWLMALVSVALAVWWILTVPYVPRHMYQAIPARSIFVSAHRDLAGRWDLFSKIRSRFLYSARWGSNRPNSSVLEKTPSPRIG